MKHHEYCPTCHSSNVTQTHFHDPDGYQGFICSDCGQVFGN